MSVGFVMLAHADLYRAAQVAKLISDAGCPLTVHIDSRVTETLHEAFVSQVAKLPAVTLAPRIACDWGTWSLVQASRGASEALLDAHADIDHVCLISGACLPIKPIDQLQKYLSAHKDTDFIESVTIDEVPWAKGGLSDERFSMSFPFAWKRQRRLFDLWVELQRMARRKRRMPVGLKPHMGSQWWCLSRPTLERIRNDPNRAELDAYFHKVWIPDESYYQSLVRLYGTKVESRSLTLSKFDFQGKSHVFYDDHLQLLRQSPAFFARKVWPGANKVYNAFLKGDRTPPPMVRVSPAHIDRTFSQATQRRTRGRAGMAMTSRFPKPEQQADLTAASYAVFQGFSDIFEGFDKWLHENTASRPHRHLFAPDRVHFSDGQSSYVGALPDSAALRDYDPSGFLRNLIWNTRGEHQSFLMGPADNQDICPFLAKDQNATVSIVTGAWALPLLRSGRPIEVVRTEAAKKQKNEAAFLELLYERRARARTNVWTLSDFIERPHDPLQEILDGMPGVEPNVLAELPKFKPMKGLPKFLQDLRNAGMNPHLAGEIKQLPADIASGDSALRLAP